MKWTNILIFVGALITALPAVGQNSDRLSNIKTVIINTNDKKTITIPDAKFVKYDKEWTIFVNSIQKEGNLVTHDLVYTGEADGGNYFRKQVDCSNLTTRRLGAGYIKDAKDSTLITELVFLPSVLESSSKDGSTERVKEVCKLAGISKTRDVEATDSLFDFLKNASGLVRSKGEKFDSNLNFSDKSVELTLKRLTKIDSFIQSQPELVKNETINYACDIYLSMRLYVEAKKYCESYKAGTIGSQRLRLIKIIDTNIGLGDYSTAINYLKEYISLEKKEADRQKEIVIAALNSNEWIAANRGRAIGIGIDADYRSLMEKLGDVYILEGNYSEAEKSYRSSLEAHEYSKLNDRLYEVVWQEPSKLGVPNVESKQLSISYALLKQNKLTEARSIFNKVLDNYINEGRLVLNNRSQRQKDSFSNIPDGILWRIIQVLNVSIDSFEYAVPASDAQRSGYLEGNLASRLGETRIENSYGFTEEKLEVLLPIEKLKQIVRDQKATLVEYSIVDKQNLYIYVIQPNGKLFFRGVKLSSPLGLNIISSGRGLTDNSFVPIIIYGTLAIAALSLVWLIPNFKEKRNIASILIAVIFVGGGVLIYKKTDPALLSLEGRGLKDISQVGNMSLATLRGETKSKDSICNSPDECLRLQYNQLIAPIAELLPTDAASQVVFVPHLSLNSVPFAALKSPDGKYLIEKHTIRIVPSIRAMDLLSKVAKSKNSGSGSALVVGNPSMPKVAFNFFDKNELSDISPLPGTEKEATSIARILGTNPLIGQQATETLVKERLENASIIHFATHGFTNVYVKEVVISPMLGREVIEEPERNALAFTPSDNNDGLLTDKELSKMNFNADLVVLSACDTAIGVINTDGVINLARPFLSRGVTSAIVSLWQIPDAPTAELMVSFYENLKSGQNKATALRNAMLKTMKAYPDPVNWAAFSLVGNS